MRRLELNDNWTLADSMVGFEYGVGSKGARVDLPYCIKDNQTYFFRTLDDVDLNGAKKIFLIVDGVQGGAIVRINGIVVSAIMDGYESVDISDAIAKRQNIIHIEVDNQNGSAGIAGGVFLQICNSDIFVASDSISVETKEINDSFALLDVKFDVNTFLDIQAIKKKGVAVKAFIEVFNHTNKRKARKLKKFKLNKAAISLQVSVKINKPILYKPKNIDIVDELDVVENVAVVQGKPYVYTAKVTLIVDDTAIDDESTTFGVRQLGRRGKHLV